MKRVKARVRVTPKDGVLDPEGRAVQRALGDMGYSDAQEIRIGKLIEIELDCDDPAKARGRIAEMCDRLLANPVIESYEIDLD